MLKGTVHRELRGACHTSIKKCSTGYKNGFHQRAANKFKINVSANMIGGFQKSLRVIISHLCRQLVVNIWL